MNGQTHKFVPEPDITAYELASILAAIPMTTGAKGLAEMPGSVWRHFKPLPCPTMPAEMVPIVEANAELVRFFEDDKAATYAPL